jgi:opacity protein-like surface antigen
MKRILPLFSALIFSGILHAQDSSLLKMLNDSMAAQTKPFFVTGTFKATHIVNMQTVEAPAAGSLTFVIQHRFGQLNSGIYNFFGLDNATLRLGLDYGITDRLAVGIGRSSYQKTYDGYLKYKLLRQTDGSLKMPVTVSILGTFNYYTLEYPVAEKPDLTTSDRISYSAQLLIARKFSRNLSIQFTPTFLHYNLVPTDADKNNVFALSAGGRMKITKRMSINVEYNYLLPNQVVSTPVHNSFSLGWDIETGGHVFQLVFTNSQSVLETQYITQTTGNWGNGGIYFGFNISRNFNITKKAKSSVKS